MGTGRVGVDAGAMGAVEIMSGDRAGAGVGTDWLGSNCQSASTDRLCVDVEAERAERDAKTAGVERAGVEVDANGSGWCEQGP